MVPTAQQGLESWLHAKDIDGSLQRAHAATQSLLQGAPDRLRRLAEDADTYWTIRTRTRKHHGPQAHVQARELAAELRRASDGLNAMQRWIHDGVRRAQLLRRWAQVGDTIEADRAYLRAAIALYQHAFPDSPVDLEIRVSTRTALWRALLPALAAGGLATVAAGVVTLLLAGGIFLLT